MLGRRQFLASSAAFAAAGCSTLPDAAVCARFGFITDCHYAPHLPRAKDGRNYAGSLAKMRAFVRAMNAAGVDFVVEGGDFKDLGRTPAESLANLDALEAAFAEFRGPRFHVLGNHDHDNLTKAEFLAHVTNGGQKQAKPYYSFLRNNITFIVLDACWRPDGTPYDRGNFNWRKAFLPPEQVAFLEAELARAPGWCVPFLHQQLDAEDDTCIANAAEVRAILEKSGKVRCVFQGHLHEGSFREVNGIGYFTAKAAVMNDAATFACVEILSDGTARVTGHGEETPSVAHTAAGWTGDAAWRPGHYQVHFIYTGRGESMLHIFPDGTSLLVDCGDSMRFHKTPQEVPLLPDISRRAGEWVARYVKRVNPKGAHVDYFHLSHYHEDHCGGARWNGGTVKAATGDYYLCGLADAMRFLSFGTVVDRAYPTFDDPIPVLAGSRDGTPDNVRNVYAALAARGTKIERFRLGARDQFVQRDAAAARAGFDVFNFCANGRYVRKDGSVRDLYGDRVKAGAKKFNENGMSCGFVVRYGKFAYYTAGDFSDGFRAPGGARGQIEDELAEALGRVQVAKCNHHGHHSMFPKLVQALKPRVWTACVLDQQHMTDDTCARLADRTLYPGERLLLPEYMPLARPETPAGRAWLPHVARAVREEPCHLVLDVPEGGDSYSFYCFAAADETPRLKARWGFYSWA